MKVVNRLLVFLDVCTKGHSCLVECNGLILDCFDANSIEWNYTRSIHNARVLHGQGFQSCALPEPSL